MTRWFQSGQRRDLCILLYDEEPMREKALKTALQSHYDAQLKPRAVRRKLSKLVDSGHVHQQVDGLHDVYSLTAAGEAALEAHLEWARAETGLK